MLEALLLALCTTPQDAPTPPSLVLGQTAAGNVSAGSGWVDAPEFAQRGRGTRVRGERYRLTLPADARCVVTLVSHAFDGYLVLRHAGGELIAENDDGFVGRHPRLDVQLTAGDYLVLACSADGLGPFDLTWSDTPTETTTDRGALELADARAALEWVERTDESGAAGAPVDTRSRARERLARLLLDAQPEEARRLLTEAADLRRAADAPPLALARTNATLAGLLLRLGVADEARERAESALAVLESERAPQFEIAQVLDTLGNALLALGSSDDALRRLEVALDLATTAAGRSDVRTATIREHLTLALRSLGRLADAHRIDERHLESLRSELGAGHALTRALLLDTADLARQQADLERARVLLEEALAANESEPLERARTESRLARVMIEGGQARSALPLLDAALPVLEQRLGSTHSETLDCAHGRARALVARGRDEAAATELRRVILERESRGLAEDTTRALVELAEVELRRTGRDECRRLLLRARQILVDALGEGHPRSAAIDLSLADLALERGEPDLARTLVDRAIVAGEQALGETHPFVAKARLQLAAMLHGQGRFDEALPHAAFAAETLRTMLGAHHAQATRATAALVRLRVDRGELGEARAFLVRAIADRANSPWRAVTYPTQRDRFAALTAERELLELLGGLTVDTDATTPRIELFEALVAWEARQSGDRFAGVRALEQRFGEGAKSALSTLRAIEFETARLASPFELDRSPTLESPTARLLAARERARAQQGELLRHLRQPAEPIPFERLAWGLPPRSVLLAFHTLRTYTPVRAGAGPTPGSWSEPRLIAWVVRSNPSRLVRVDLGSAETLRVVAHAFQDLLAADARGDLPADGPTAGSPEALLAELVWQPLSSHVGDSDTVFVVPDALTSAIPFEVLTHDGRFLLERFAFVHLTDPSDLFAPAPTPMAEIGGLLTVGGIDTNRRAELPDDVRAMDASAPRGSRGAFLHGSTVVASDEVAARYGPWADLPDSTAECDLVSRLHTELAPTGTARVALRGPHGGPDRLRIESRRHAVLHFATRAFFPGPAANVASLYDPRPGSPAPPPDALAPGELCGLVGSGADQGGGLLPCAEIAAFGLTGTNLVVLSSTAPRAGDLRVGEGFLGLLRTFDTAGAKTVVSARWVTPAPEARALLEAFYRNLWARGLGPGAALRQAQLARLAAARAEGRARPAAWGGLCLSGEWR